MSGEIAKFNVSVIGGGSFGTIIAQILAENGCKPKLYIRDPEHCSVVATSRKNEKYLPGLELHPNISYTSAIAEALVEVNFLYLAMPSKAYRSVLAELKSNMSLAEIDTCVFVSLAKGIEAGTFKLMSEVIREVLATENVAVLSGPNLAKEIAKKELTGSVVASRMPEVNQNIQQMLSSNYFRVYDNVDIYGVELAGALKNIYAIAAGMASAFGMGENAKSMLLTRGLAEMSRFAVAMGANPITFLGLAGVGDLVVTCSSPLSRNFRFGVELAKGESVDQALENISQTVEGMYAVKVVCEKADQNDIYMPIAQGLYKILYDKEPILQVVEDLMTGESSQDVEFSKPS